MLISRTSILSSRLRYGAVAQLFHWLTVVLVGTAYILSPGGREERVYSAAVDSARQTHETIGILVFVLLLLRILWRLFEPTPEPAPVAPWMKYSASAAHVALYALLVTIPLTAIAGAWLEAHPVTIFGIGNVGPMLPCLIGRDRPRPACRRARFLSNACAGSVFGRLIVADQYCAIR
jgi:cytochrome b561